MHRDKEHPPSKPFAIQLQAYSLVGDCNVHYSIMHMQVILHFSCAGNPYNPSITCMGGEMIYSDI